MKKKSRNRNRQPWRLPLGQRIIITSAVNSCGLPLGATGTVVKMRCDPVVFPSKNGSKCCVSKVDDDYFWGNWEEQFVEVDGGDGRPIQVRRFHMAPIDEWVPGTRRTEGAQ